MKLYLLLLKHRALRVLALACVFNGGFAFSLTTATPVEDMSINAKDPLNAAAPVPMSPYRSAFENYRPLTVDKVQPWRETNDNVGRIGGWRVYLRESQSGVPAPAPVPAAPVAIPATPALPVSTPSANAKP